MLKRIAVLVSGGGTNLQAIIDAKENGIIQSGELAAVISSSPSAYAIKRAEAGNVPVFVVDRKAYKNSDEFSAKLIETLEQVKPDLVVLAGFMCILNLEFIKRFENCIINVHPSLIPAFCGPGHYGLKVHEKALEYGVKVSGATVHFVNEITDGGAIILQKAVEVKAEDTPEELQKRVMEQAEWQLLPKAIELFCSDRLEINGRIVTVKE